MNLIEALARRRIQAAESPPAPSHDLIEQLRDSHRISPPPELLPDRRRSVKLKGTPVERAILEGYEKNVWLFSGIRIIARALMSVPLVVEVNRGDGWEPGDPGRDGGVRELTSLIERPSPRTVRQELVERIGIMWNLAGKVLLHKTMVNERLPRAEENLVRELRVLTTLGFKVESDADGEIERYVYEKGAFRKVFDAGEIIDITSYSPSSPLDGLGGGMVADRSIVSDNEAVSWQLASYANRAVGSGVFVTPEPVAPEERDEVLEYVQSKMGSSAAREPWVMGSSWKWQDMDRSPVEMDFVASREQTLLAIAASINLNPAFLKPDSKYSNLEMARESLWKENVIPLEDLVVSKLNAGLIPHFGDPELLRISYDVSDVEALREDVESKVTSFREAVEAGVPYNDASEYLGMGLPPLPEGVGDVPHGTNASVMISRERRAEGTASRFALNPSRSLPAANGMTQSVPPAKAEVKGDAFPMPENGKVYIDEIHMIRGQTGAEEASDELFELAESSERDLVRMIRRAFEDSAELVNRDRVREEIESGGEGDLPRILGLDDWSLGRTEEGEDGEEAVVIRGLAMAPAADIAAEGGELGMEQLSQAAGQKIEYSPDVEGHVREWADAELASIVSFVRDGSTRAVQDAVSAVRGSELDSLWSRSKEEGLDSSVLEILVAAAALTAPQWSRSKKFLAEVDGRAGLDEAVRKTNLLMTQLRNARAATIGTDLAVKSTWGGQGEAWDESVRQGKVVSGSQRWMHSGDILVCPICLGLGGVEADLGEPFISQFNGRAYMKPGDPHPGTCRCGRTIVEVVV